MAVDQITNYVPTYKQGQQALTKTLGQQDFMKLLVAELANQDPTEPMKDREFIAQMASFSSLEQMQQLNSSFELLSYNISDVLVPNLMLQQATTMIGRDVSYLNEKATGEDDLVLTGNVKSVIIKSGQPYVVMEDGKEISMEYVLSVFSGTPENDVLQKILSGLDKINQRLDALSGNGETE